MSWYPRRREADRRSPSPGAGNGTSASASSPTSPSSPTSFRHQRKDSAKMFLPVHYGHHRRGSSRLRPATSSVKLPWLHKRGTLRRILPYAAAGLLLYLILHKTTDAPMPSAELLTSIYHTAENVFWERPDHRTIQDREAVVPVGRPMTQYPGMEFPDSDWEHIERVLEADEIASLQPQDDEDDANTLTYATKLPAHLESAALEKAEKRWTKRLKKAQAVDMRYCGMSPCKFLFPARIGEQESKAQIHLFQLAQLSKELGRILVLPNIHQGRLGACQKFGFGQYFEVGSLDSFGVKTITQGEFQRWVHERRIAPTAQISVVDATIDGGSWPWSKGGFHIELEKPPTWDYLIKRSCMNRYHLDWSKHQIFPIIYEKDYFSNKRRGDAFAKELIKSFTQDDMALGRGLTLDEATAVNAAEGDRDLADVLVVHTDLRHPFMNLPSGAYNLGNPPPLPHAPLKYAKRWSSLATSLSKRMYPYIAVHWRMELVPPENLPQCALDLVEMLKDISKGQVPSATSNRRAKSAIPKVKTIYLATDYPLEDPDGGKNGIKHSGTFKEITDQHHEAIRLLKKGLGETDLRLTTLLLEVANAKEPMQVPAGDDADADQDEATMLAEPIEEIPMDIVDPGLLGIIDKMVAIRSQIFVSGQPRCARKSSFSGQIINERRTSHKSSVATYPSLWNSVEWWGM